MPPANSPSGTPTSPPSASYLPQLHELETPVPDLASTLTTQAEPDSVEFLRAHPATQELRPPSTARRRRPLARSTAESDRWLRERLMARARQLHSPPSRDRPNAGRSTVGRGRDVGGFDSGRDHGRWASDSRLYGDRVPHRQSLYDWAPEGGDGSEEGRINEGPSSSDLEDVARNSTSGRNSVAPTSLPRLWAGGTPPPLRSLQASESSSPAGGSTLAANEIFRNAMRNATQPSIERPSHVIEQPSEQVSYRAPQYSNLQSQAIAQAIRRHPRVFQRPRTNPDNGSEDEIRHARRVRHEEETRERLRQARLLRPPRMISPGERRQEPISSRDVMTVVDTYRQRYLQNPSSNFSSTGGSLEEVIRYLHRLRSSPTEEESLSLALDSGVIRDGFRDPQNHDDDFILDAASVKPPPETSWLSAGSVFEGSQHATRTPNTITRRLDTTTSFTDSSSGLPIPSTNTRSSGATNSSSYHPQTITVIGPGATDPSENSSDHSLLRERREDKWPVRVTIHSVNYDDMRLSGEMEAFNVPDGRSPDGKSSITTYLEGEIIDFNNHTLETKNYYSSALTDGTYWRELMPFRACTDDAHLARCLVSKRWLKEYISKDWILMRWKEKHFLHPSDQRLGLTISGFYYVSLRRSDGFIEGLYYDPNSAPYQHLVLRPPGNGCDGDGSGYFGSGGGRRAEFPVYQFR
ncbi:MAG: hypothetical protein M1837_004088 [Sclerophora amabilis]|nr:MAG: hypothetical protein M1837_004088 [Sclerophora amabilis]